MRYYSFNAIDFTFSKHKNLIMFFLFVSFVILRKALIIPVIREKIKVKAALSIPTGAPTTLADEMIQTPLLVPLRTVKILSL